VYVKYFQTKTNRRTSESDSLMRSTSQPSIKHPVETTDTRGVFINTTNTTSTLAFVQFADSSRTFD